MTAGLFEQIRCLLLSTRGPCLSMIVFGAESICLVKVAAGGQAVAVQESGISWKQDRHKYARIPASNFQTVPALRGGAGINGTLDADEHFIVWMRPAALPNFRKLWGTVQQDIPKGTILSVTIQNR